MEQLPRLYLTREEMMKRVARFKDLKGSDGGLPDSKHAGLRAQLLQRHRLPAAGRTEARAVTSPVGDDAARHRRHQDQRRLQPRLLQGQAGPRAR